MQKAPITIPEDLDNLERDSEVEINKLVEQMEAYKPADDSAPAATLSKARQRLCEIKPVRCRHAGCTHLGPTSEIEKHEAMCLFALTLMPHAAIVKTAGDCLNGFELVVGALQSRHRRVLRLVPPFQAVKIAQHGSDGDHPVCARCVGFGYYAFEIEYIQVIRINSTVSVFCSN